VVTLVLPRQRRSTFTMLEKAGVEPVRTNVVAGAPELTEVTGARAVSGVPVPPEPEFHRTPRPARGFHSGDRPRHTSDRPWQSSDRPRPSSDRPGHSADRPGHSGDRPGEARGHGDARGHRASGRPVVRRDRPRADRPRG
jgi:hypothetical protein